MLDFVHMTDADLALLLVACVVAVLLMAGILIEWAIDHRHRCWMTHIDVDQLGESEAAAIAEQHYHAAPTRKG